MEYGTKSRKPKWFPGVILVLLLLLTVSVVAFAQPRSTYTLEIRKLLAPGAPAEAYNAKYKFKVAQGDSEPKEVEITGEGKTTFSFDLRKNTLTITEIIDEATGAKLDNVELRLLSQDGVIQFHYRDGLKLVCPSDASGKFVLIDKGKHGDRKSVV